jgi:hypothetical protein
LLVLFFVRCGFSSLPLQKPRPKETALSVKARPQTRRQTGAANLKHQLERNRQVRSPADSRNQDPRLRLLQRWQAERLAQDYEPLRHNPKNRLACDFFLYELYGDQDFSKRDQDVERIYPIMVKLLPPMVLETVARAVELNAMSHELDLTMVNALPNGELSLADYQKAYRLSNQNGERRHQLALILSLGRELARVVQIPLMYKLLQACRWPAKLAGLGALQAFLERGFAAFVALEGAKPFLNAIRLQETQFMQACLVSKR